MHRIKALAMQSMHAINGFFAPESGIFSLPAGAEFAALIAWRCDQSMRSSHAINPDTGAPYEQDPNPLDQEAAKERQAGLPADCRLDCR
ncbi:MAG: hypothetical protein RR311_00150 [Comamonas sp.]